MAALKALSDTMENDPVSVSHSVQSAGLQDAAADKDTVCPSSNARG